MLTQQTWPYFRNSQRSEELSGPQYLGPDSPSSMSSSLLDIEELTSAMNLSGKEVNLILTTDTLFQLLEEKKSHYENKIHTIYFFNINIF